MSGRASAAMPSLLLAALAVAACGRLAAGQVTPVTTFQELQQAIASKAPHIELRAHLDLREKALGKAAIFENPQFQTLRVRARFSFRTALPRRGRQRPLRC